MEEIKQVLKTHDIAAIVVLHNIEGDGTVTKDSVHVQGYTEFLFHINTGYSAASFENDRFKVKGKKLHYSSAKERDIKVAGAVNMLEHLQLWSGKMCLQAGEMSDALNRIVEKINDDDNEGTTTTHSQQNN